MSKKTRIFWNEFEFIPEEYKTEGGDMGKKGRRKRGTNIPITSYVKTSAVNTPSFWESGIKVLSSCELVKPEEKKVLITPLVKNKIDALMKEYPNCEWLGYLIGIKETLLVTDIVIPKQTASSARVDDIEFDEDIETIGVIHSHHNMGNNFSGTDHEFINQNHDISLLVSHKGITGQVRQKLPCGHYVINDCRVNLHLDTDFDVDDFIEDAKEKISKKTYSYVGTHNPYDYASQGYRKSNPFPSSTQKVSAGWDTEEMDEIDDNYLIDDLKKSANNEDVIIIDQS